MLRSNERLLEIRSFGGVTDFVDEVRLAHELSSWTHGGYPTAQGRFRRLPGKRPFPSSNPFGHVLFVGQLGFMDKDVVLVHHSSNWIVEADISVLLPESVETVTPLEPMFADE